MMSISGANSCRLKKEKGLARSIVKLCQLLPALALTLFLHNTFADPIEVKYSPAPGKKRSPHGA